MCGQGRGGGGSLRRSVPTQGCSTSVRRGRKKKEGEEEGGRRKKREEEEEDEGK